MPRRARALPPAAPRSVVLKSSLSSPAAGLALAAGPAFAALYLYAAGWARLAGPLAGAGLPLDAAVVEDLAGRDVVVLVVARRLVVAAGAVDLALLAIVSLLVSLNSALPASRLSLRGAGGVAAATAPALLASLGCAGGCGGVSAALLSALLGAGAAASIASAVAGHSSLLLASSAALLALSLAWLARGAGRRGGLRIELPRRGMRP